MTANGSDHVRTFFDENVQDYEAKHYGGEIRSFMSVRQTRILEMVDALQLPRGAKVLDAGCGAGYLLEALAHRGLQVYGLDAAAGMISRTGERLRAIAPEYPFDLRQGNIEHLPFANDTFDLVCSAGVIEYMSEDRLVLQEAMRVLKPGGSFILPVTNFWSPANSLEFFVEFLKRRSSFLRVFNSIWTRMGNGPVLPRHFKVRRHRPRSLRKALVATGFLLRDQVYFYFLPWPRPFDRIFPRATRAVEQRLDGYGRARIGPLAEGYLTHSSKPSR